MAVPVGFVPVKGLPPATVLMVFCAWHVNAKAASKNNGKRTRFMTILRYGAAIQEPGEPGAERTDALMHRSWRRNWTGCTKQRGQTKHSHFKPPVQEEGRGKRSSMGQKKWAGDCSPARRRSNGYYARSCLREETIASASKPQPINRTVEGSGTAESEVHSLSNLKSILRPPFQRSQPVSLILTPENVYVVPSLTMLSVFKSPNAPSNKSTQASEPN